MEDEEEIDIIGDYDDISKISSGQLLTCDYTVHPKWVNENAEGGNFWSDSVPKHENLENNVEVLHSEEVVIEEHEGSHRKIIDLEWAGEVNSQNDDIVFEDDIPATTEEIIQDDVFEECADEEECIEHILYQKSLSPDLYSDTTEYDEGVAAFETHPAPKNNKYIGPTSSRSLLKVKIENPQLFSPNPRSLLKNNCFNLVKQQSKFKKTLTISNNVFEQKIKSTEFLKNITPNKETKKFKQSLKIAQTKDKKFKIKKSLKPELETDQRRNFQSSNLNNFPSKKGTKIKKKGPVPNYGENITINHDIEKDSISLLKKSFSFPLNNSIKLQKVESDIEVDIEADLGEEEIIDLKKSLFGTAKKENDFRSEIQVLNESPKQASIMNFEINKTGGKRKSSVEGDEIEISDELAFQIRKNLATPKHELVMEANKISDLEKYFNLEFFDGRSSTKTPEQYLRIRNHILTMWNVMGKNGYVSKTSVRSGLKHGGDVNSISRIHRLLEQIGAINFGYQGKYFEYVRPLEDYFSMFLQHKCQFNSSISTNVCNYLSSARIQRNRTRTNYYNLDNASEFDSELNYTIKHQQEISFLTPNRCETESVKHIKTEQDLVRCHRFSKENLAPFKISITLSTLLCFHLHSLSSNNEVIGLIGGHRSKSIGRNKLCMTRYKPCTTTEHSGTMCEMCPISQLDQSASLKNEGYELLAWFHSHPAFSPNPSRTDIQTQVEMQMQFSAQTDRTFVGVIFSCIDLSFRCIYVLPKDYSSNLNNLPQPYELDTDVIKDCTNLKNDIQDVLHSIELKNESNNAKSIIIEKFKQSSQKILKQYGYDPETFFNDIL